MDLKWTSYKLTDIAEIRRAEKNKCYKTGTVYVQVSASDGQTYMLKSSGFIECKYAVIEPKIYIYPAYFLETVRRKMPEFLARNKTTINIQIESFQNFNIEIHDSIQTQICIAELMKKADEVMETELELKECYKTFKKTMLGKMMV